MRDVGRVTSRVMLQLVSGENSLKWLIDKQAGEKTAGEKNISFILTLKNRTLHSHVGI